MSENWIAKNIKAAASMKKFESEVYTELKIFKDK